MIYSNDFICLDNCSFDYDRDSNSQNNNDSNVANDNGAVNNSNTTSINIIMKIKLCSGEEYNKNFGMLIILIKSMIVIKCNLISNDRFRHR